MVYLFRYDRSDVAARVAVERSVSEVTVRKMGARPYRIIPLTKEMLPKSTLGKLSRSNIQTTIDRGAFSNYEEFDDVLVRGWKRT